MIKVSYDISVLGTGYFLNRARTGIARVIENLAIELASRSDVDLYFSSYQSIDVFFKTREYLKNQSILNPSRLELSDKWVSRKAAEFLEWYGTASVENLRKRDFFSKVNRKILGHLAMSSQLFSRNTNLACLAGKEVLHTPFLCFPKNSENIKQLKRFVTVYDLIPILFPQYFKFNESRTIENMIKKVTSNDFVFSISQSTKRDLCNYADIDPARVYVTPLAASDIFRPCVDHILIESICCKYGIPNSPYILSLCTLEPRKNIDQTIKSFCRLVEQEKINDLNLVLVGTRGWKFDQIFEEIGHAASLKERIFITGYVPDEDLSPLYSGALMFVYPSFYEGFGLPPLEAMQCGVPVITSNTSSLPEVVGTAGIMVDPTDGDALSQAMSDLYNSADLRSALSKKGIERAKTFSWGRCAAETVQAYQAAISLS